MIDMMINRWLMALAALGWTLILTVAPVLAQAVIPPTLNFQGYLTNTAGTPISGTVPMVFSIYAADTEGQALWTESHPAVVLTAGVCSVLLGETNPVDLLFNAPYYLGIQVGADPEMTPRLPLSSVGYAYRAGTAEQALIQGFPVSPAVPSANQVLSFNGTNWGPSAVNLGTDPIGVLPVSQVGFIAPSQASRTNTINTLDSAGDVGYGASITIGANGFPIIAYFDLTNQDLKVVKCGDPSCSPGLVTLRTLDTAGDVGFYNSITIGAAGFPVIAYYDGTNGDLKVAKCGDASCSSVTLQTLDATGDVGGFTSITIGADGFPVISYYDLTNQDLMVAKCGDASCSSVTLRTLDSTGRVGGFTSITIGADGFPVISYYDYTNEDLKVAKCGDASCSPGSVTLRTMDSTGNVGYDASITIGADGFPIIAYRDSTNQDLKVAKCGDASCSPGSVTLRTLYTGGFVGWFTSITIGVDGFPIISYHDNTNGDLKVAKCGDASCSSVTRRTLDATGEVGWFTSITIGVDGFPIVAYYDLTNRDLKVAKCGNPYCLNNWWRR